MIYWPTLAKHFEGRVMHLVHCTLFVNKYMMFKQITSNTFHFILWQDTGGRIDKAVTRCPPPHLFREHKNENITTLKSCYIYLCHNSTTCARSLWLTNNYTLQRFQLPIYLVFLTFLENINLSSSASEYIHFAKYLNFILLYNLFTQKILFSIFLCFSSVFFQFLLLY